MPEIEIRDILRMQLAEIVFFVTGKAPPQLTDNISFVDDLKIPWEHVLNELLDLAAEHCGAEVSGLDPFELTVGILLDRIPVLA